MRVRNHTNPLNYFTRKRPLDLTSVFPNYQGCLDIDVGFGRGVFLRKYAEDYPERSIMGIDVRKAMVDILADRLKEQAIKNVYLDHGNALISISDMLPDGCIDRIFVFHPDPWLKKRHHKRRVVSMEFLNVLAKKMMPSGRLYISTDVKTLWSAMTQTLSDSPYFLPVDNDPFWSEYYTSHWTEFSVRDQRHVRMGTFVRS